MADIAIQAKSKAEVGEMLREAVAKSLEAEKNYARKFRFTESAEDGAKLAQVEKQVGVVKFLNALKNEDWNYVREQSAQRAKALNETTANAGGYLVPEEFERMLNSAYDEYSEIRRDATVLSMSSDVKRLNELTAKVSVAKKGELVAIVDTVPTFGESVLTAEKYTASTTLSEELIEDSEIDIVSEIARMFGEQIAYAEQNSFVNSAVSGSEGLLQVAGVTAISLITGTTFAELSFDDLAAMQKSLFTYNKAEAMRGKFYMSMTAYNALRTSKASTSGNYFYMPAVPTQEAPATAWGRPIVVLNEFPTTTATATKFVVYADLKKHFFIGDRRGIRIKVNTSGTSASGHNLNIQDAREMVVTKRTAQATSLEAGIITLATN